MNEKKISFITCVNDIQIYRQCLSYINNLEVPVGYEVECIKIENAESMAKGYNEAMKSSNAKYKVYLHQDVYIKNKDFIKNFLYVCKNNYKIGMLGVAGAKVLPTNGIWWESQQNYGKVYDSHTGEMELITFRDVLGEYEEVQAIDGLIMITQYDVNWRDDIFDGWHLYDISQCMEFKNAGYKVAIPNQKDHWCVHDCGVVNVKHGYEEYRKNFLDEYSKDIYPLVSILIPTHNRPKYFQIALESAINQTYRNIEIIISDDGIDEKTENIIKEKYLVENNNIKYFNNQKNLGQVDNVLKLLNLANSKYISFLYDDDVFNINKIEIMMNYFIQYESYGIALVTSDRNLIDESGNIIKRFLGETFFNNNNALICLGKNLSEDVIKNHYNIIGEPTTVLFNKEKLTENFAHYSGRKFLVNIDEASWFNLLKSGNAVIINDCLSSFRWHKNQISQDSSLVFNGLEENVFFVLTAKSNGFFENDMAYKEALEYCITYVNNVSQRENIIKESYQLLDKLNTELEKVMRQNKYGINFGKIGDNVIIENQCNFVHSEKISIGKDVHISEKSKFVILYPNSNNESKLIINDYCQIGETCSISVANKIVIEKKVTIGKNVHIADLYEYKKVDIPILTDGSVLINSNIIIQHGTQIADNVVIKGNVKIGRNSIIEANSVVLSDIPDRCVAMGIPAKVKEAFDYETGMWIKIENEEQLKAILDKREIVKPILTIGIPTYNRSKYLKKCLNFIYDDIGDEPLVEVLVSDNYSSDNTQDIVTEYKSKYRNLKYYRNNENIGPSDNFAKIFELATGDYINLHGDDDYFKINVINNIINMIYKNRDCGLVNIVRKQCEFNIETGVGLNEYMLNMLDNITFITNLIISRRDYEKIPNKRWDDEFFPHVYIQCDILNINENYCILKGDMLDGYSGEGALESIRLAKKEETINHHKNFGKVFIEEYLTLLNECRKYGLTVKTLQVLKERNVDMVIIPQMHSYKSLKIECDYVEVIKMFKKHYSKESYYEIALNKIKEIINS